MGHEFLENCCLCSLCWIFAGGPPREEGACHHCQTEGPTALGFWNTQDQLFITYSNQRVSAKATSREISQTCLLPDKAGCVTVLATFLQLSKMHFLGGVKTYGVAGISVGGGGKRMVENCVPWYCWHNWEGGGGKRMVQRGGGETYQIFGLQKSKSGPIQNPEQSSTIACTELCFAPGWLW